MAPAGMIRNIHTPHIHQYGNGGVNGTPKRLESQANFESVHKGRVPCHQVTLIYDYPSTAAISQLVVASAGAGAPEDQSPGFFPTRGPVLPFRY